MRRLKISYRRLGSRGRYPRNWCKLVNEPQAEAEVDAIRRCVSRGQPYGDQDWVRRTVKRLGLESTLRAPHRPRKTTTD